MGNTLNIFKLPFFFVFTYLGTISCASTMPEQMVDLGEFQLYARDVGTGRPAVIFENALGGFSGRWKNLQDELAKTTRVIAYDRAGNGRSQMSPYPRTNRQMVKELHSLLQKLEIRPPYVLVGTMFGSFIARTFTHEYPEDVVGLALIDPTHEDLLPAMQKLRKKGQWESYLRMLDQMAEIASEGAKQEWANYFSNADSVRSIPLPKNIPVVILSSDCFGYREKNMKMTQKDIDLKIKLHAELIANLPHARQIFTHTSGYDIAAVEQEFLVEVIRDLVHQFR